VKEYSVSDFDDVGNALGGTVLGLVAGVTLGVGFHVFVLEESAWSITKTAFCGSAVCGSLGMVFNRPLMRFVKIVVRWWISF
jgi:hypothetical protein